jgi:catechol 2,3-dioxygenase-like lactoylglutathione lyase family enzyme
MTPTPPRPLAHLELHTPDRATARAFYSELLGGDLVKRSEELVRAVYEELHRAGPAGLRYMTFKLEDGVSFLHIAESETPENPLSEVAAFQEFQRQIADRCEEQPVSTELTEIGSYRAGAD